MPAKNKVLLIVMDGWGLSAEKNGNAPLLAKTPVLDYLYATYPKTSLSASGLEVGLNPGEPGNSEVGHMNLGSGRVVWENLPLINQAIENKSFFENKVFLEAIDYAKKNNSRLHLWGLISDGGVHSHISHFLALIDLVSQQGIKDVLIHFVADGRDTEPKKAKEYVAKLEEAFASAKIGRIASVAGRYFAMDRDKNWDRVKQAYDVMTNSDAPTAESAKAAIDSAYQANKSDEFIPPCRIGQDGEIRQKDAVILVNFRADRARQMMDVLLNNQDNFAHDLVPGLFVATMMSYEKNQKPAVAFPKEDLSNTLADVLANGGLTQFHVAETEKYAHVTYFFNGGHEQVHNRETQSIVPSKKVATYDQAPEMSAAEVSAKVIEATKVGYDLIVVNFANGDMVGHTGEMDAAVSACETVDKCLGEILPAASGAAYRVLITADHGNCEVMIDPKTGGPCKEHTVNPVPFITLDFSKIPYTFTPTDYSESDYLQYASGSPIGILADVAPSVLGIMEIAKPPEIAGMDLTTAM